jgi:hypothetical protein
MMFTWFIAFNGLTNGWATLAFLREGNVTAIEDAQKHAMNRDSPFEQVVEVEAAARLRAITDARQITFPLGVAKMLLAGFLLVASGMALGGRKGARSLALQALAANAALAVIDYALTSGVRTAWIDAIAQARDTMPYMMPQQALLMNPEWLWWGERIRLVVVDIGAVGLAVLALTSRRSKNFFAAAAAAATAEADER